MNKTNLINNWINGIRAVRNLITGNSFGSIRSFYDPRYPPTKFLKRNPHRINVRCIICGYPRTGTHWIGNVVEKSSGKRTYNLFDKKPTPSDKNVCLLKIHARNQWWARAKALWLMPRHSFAGKYIYVYRDPRDSIISLYEMYKNAKGNAELKPTEFLKLYDPIRQYQWEINAWVLKNHRNILLVKFEDMKSHPVATFERILSYLGLDDSVDHESIGEKVAGADTKSRPRATAHGWKQASPEYQHIIDAVNRKLNREIGLLGYKDV